MEFLISAPFCSYEHSFILSRRGSITPAAPFSNYSLLDYKQEVDMNDDMDMQGMEQREAADQTGDTGADQESRAEVKTFTQEEVDKIVEKRLNRERKKFASVLEGTDPREAELAERERAVAEKELRLDAAETMRTEGLPMEALELLNYTDKESCEQSIELVRTVFQANVQAAVERRLRGGAPMKKGPSTLEEQADPIRNAFRA